ncbi:uroporphyrinogen-III synthase [Flavobacteriaceae bacterium]|nr:uroporphyrinogen-III synthase [Flavobacteriaceae bacterium]
MKSKAPARICLFGDHQDYLGLPVIACAINKYMIVEGVPNNANYLLFTLINLNKIIKINLNEDLSVQIEKYNEESYLIPCANVLSPAIPKKLDELGVRWTQGTFFKTAISDLSSFKNVYYDILVFFSPSGIESLISNFPDFKQNDTRIAVFGKTTVKAAEKAGLRIDILAPTPKVPSMSKALDIYIEKANKK